MHLSRLFDNQDWDLTERALGHDAHGGTGRRCLPNLVPVELDELPSKLKGSNQPVAC